MAFSKKLLLIVVWVCSTLIYVQPCQAEDPVKFFVLIASYNNALWAKKNLESVFLQSYPHWTIYYVDDCSTDGTGDIVENYIQERGFKDKVTVIHNSSRKGALANYYAAIHTCDPHTVVVNLDGDDWLAHDKVLERLASIYSDPNIWMTYGSYITDPPGYPCVAAPFPEEVVKTCSFRKYERWGLSHLRTYYAKLFQKIPKEDFFYKDEFIKVCTDPAYMLPIVEMASKGHFLFVEEVLYIYNYSNPLSIFKSALPEALEVAAFIGSKPSYIPLDVLF